MSPPTVHDPATYWEAYHLHGPGRTRARSGYVCYATTGATNARASGPGWGSTERDALLAATYWSNQPYRVVPASRAPRWAIEQHLFRQGGER